MSVGVGLGVLHEIMAAEIDEVVDARASTTRTAGWCVTARRVASVTLGWAPGARRAAADPGGRRAGEVELQTSRRFVARGAFTDVALERMLAGVLTRRYARTGEPVGSDVDDHGLR